MNEQYMIKVADALDAIADYIETVEVKEASEVAKATEEAAKIAAEKQALEVQKRKDVEAPIVEKISELNLDSNTAAALKGASTDVLEAIGKLVTKSASTPSNDDWGKVETTKTGGRDMDPIAAFAMS